MVPTQLRCVVGIDVAKAAQVVCAVEAPGGAVRQRPLRIDASTEGDAQLVGWLKAWGNPETLLFGLEATGVLWEPLFEAVTRAGSPLLVLNPRQTASWAASLGLRAKTDRIDARAPFARTAGRLRSRQYLALGDPPILAHPHPRSPRFGAEPDGRSPALAGRIGAALAGGAQDFAPARGPG